MKCTPRAGWALVGFGIAISLFLALSVWLWQTLPSRYADSCDLSEYISMHS